MIWPQTRTYSQDSTTCKNHDKLEYFGQLRLTSIWYPEQPAPTECPIPSILDAKMISFSFQCQMNPSSLLLPLCGHWNVHAHTHAGTKLWKGVGRSRAVSGWKFRRCLFIPTCNWLPLLFRIISPLFFIYLSVRFTVNRFSWSSLQTEFICRTTANARPLV